MSFEAQLPDQSAVIRHLLDNGKISREAIDRAEAVAPRTRQPLERVLNQLGQLSDDDLAVAYAEVTSLPLWDPVEYPASVDWFDLGLGQEFLRRVKVVPLALIGDSLHVAAVDPFDDEMRAGLSFATGKDIVFSSPDHPIGGAFLMTAVMISAPMPFSMNAGRARYRLCRGPQR